MRTHIVTQSTGVERDEASSDLVVRLTSLSSPRLEDTQLLTGRDKFDSSGSVARVNGQVEVPAGGQVKVPTPC